MSRISFENYGKTARYHADATIVSGRYTIQKNAERLILADVVTKLSLAPEDHLLEIGCGPGNLLIPLSFMVQSTTGIDHPDVCARLHKRFTDTALRTIGINFLDFAIESSHVFDKILVYSVLNTLANRAEASAFIDKAVSLLAPGGRMLIGDIANTDRKRRFLASEAGRHFQRDWEARMTEAKTQAAEQDVDLAPDPQVFQPDDEFILAVLGRIRRSGLHAYVLPQPADLPFGQTREDILVVAPR